jgi:hypothetical protein
MKDEDVRYFIGAVDDVVNNIDSYRDEYTYIIQRNEFIHTTEVGSVKDDET